MARRRRIFIGDIQGCLDQLEALLDAVEFRAGRDVLLPVGDLINRGPDSDGVLRLCMELDAQPVLGNHDLNMLRKGKVRDKVHVGWLESQPIVRVLDDLIMVHAGLHPRWDAGRLSKLKSDDIEFATNVRYCDKKGRRPDSDWPPPGPPFRPWDDFYRGDKRVVFGHWARRGLVVRKHCIGLDTGCLYGGKLTAWIAEKDRIVQVPGLDAEK